MTIARAARNWPKRAVNEMKEELRDIILDNAEPVDCGIFAPPTDAQKAMSLLIDFFLGDDWYVAYSCNSRQVNTEALGAIMDHPGNKSFLRKFLRRRKGR